MILSDIMIFPELVHEFEGLGTSFNSTVLGVSSTFYEPERMAASVRMLKSRVPLVFLDVGRTGRRISNLRLDYASGITLAMSHLTQLGHSRATYTEPPVTTVGLDRKEFARKGLDTLLALGSKETRPLGQAFAIGSQWIVRNSTAQA